MISAAQANARLARWSGKTDLIFRDEIEGEVRVLAGNSGRIVFEKPIIGTLVVGGFARDDARFGVLDKSQEQIIRTSDPRSDVKRVGRHLLQYSGEGERVKIAPGLRLEAQVRGMIYAKYAVGGSFLFDVDGKGMGRSHGAMLEWCLDCKVTGSIVNIGDATAEKTGQSYGLGLQSCHGCEGHDLRFEGVRYGVSLFGGGHRNSVNRVSGKASAALLDSHGGSETGLVITGVKGRVKLYNETYLGKPVKPEVTGCDLVDWGSM